VKLIETKFDLEIDYIAAMGLLLQMSLLERLPPLQSNPYSILQFDVHPSLLFRFPSSHSSSESH
jgi:hypothetical protein